jgi:hypothetical protein
VQHVATSRTDQHKGAVADTPEEKMREVTHWLEEVSTRFAAHAARMAAPWQHHVSNKHIGSRTNKRVYDAKALITKVS